MSLNNRSFSRLIFFRIYDDDSPGYLIYFPMAKDSRGLGTLEFRINVSYGIKIYGGLLLKNMLPMVCQETSNVFMVGEHFTCPGVLHRRDLAAASRNKLPKRRENVLFAVLIRMFRKLGS